MEAYNSILDRLFNALAIHGGSYDFTLLQPLEGKPKVATRSRRGAEPEIICVDSLSVAELPFPGDRSILVRCRRDGVPSEISNTELLLFPGGEWAEIDCRDLLYLLDLIPPVPEASYRAFWERMGSESPLTFQFKDLPTIRVSFLKDKEGKESIRMDSDREQFVCFSDDPAYVRRHVLDFLDKTVNQGKSEDLALYEMYLDMCLPF